MVCASPNSDSEQNTSPHFGKGTIDSPNSTVLNNSGRLVPSFTALHVTKRDSSKSSEILNVKHNFDLVRSRSKASISHALRPLLPRKRRKYLSSPVLFVDDAVRGKRQGRKIVAKETTTLLQTHAWPQTPYTVVFDLDETLAFARDPDGICFEARPHLDPLLRLLHGVSENVIWTCGMRCYASGFVHGIKSLEASSRPVIDHVIYRDRRWYTDAGRKPLTRLGRDLQHVLLIENNEHSVLSKDRKRCVMVPDYRGGQYDSSILVLMELLSGLFQQRRSVAEYLRNSPLLRERGGYYYLKCI